MDVIKCHDCIIRILAINLDCFIRVYRDITPVQCDWFLETYEAPLDMPLITCI